MWYLRLCEVGTSACTQVPQRAWDKQPGFPAVCSHAATSQPLRLGLCLPIHSLHGFSSTSLLGEVSGGQGVGVGVGQSRCWVGTSRDAEVSVGVMHPFIFGRE